MDCPESFILIKAPPGPRSAFFKSYYYVTHHQTTSVILVNMPANRTPPHNAIRSVVSTDVVGLPCHGLQCHLAEWVSTLVPRWRGYSWTASIGGHKCNVSKVIRVVQCYVIVLLYELYNAADRVHHPRAAWSRVSVTPSG